jgi:hypothetical protein
MRRPGEKSNLRVTAYLNFLMRSFGIFSSEFPAKVSEYQGHLENDYFYPQPLWNIGINDDILGGYLHWQTSTNNKDTRVDKPIAWLDLKCGITPLSSMEKLARLCKANSRLLQALHFRWRIVFDWQSLKGSIPDWMQFRVQSHKWRMRLVRNFALF